MPDDSKRPLKVFLCHASADKPTVRDLYNRLLADGVDAWLDAESLVPGQNWQVEIPKAIREADVVIVCLSEKSINKEGYVQKEIKFALDVADEKPEGTIFIIPARLEECNYLESLKRFHGVDLFEERGYGYLMRALRQQADKIGATVKNFEKGETKKNIELDRATFKRLRDLLPWNGSIQFVRERNFAGYGFSVNEHKDLYTFLDECKNPALQFMDSDLEELRESLIQKIELFLDVVGLETYPTNKIGRSAVPPDWEYERPEHFWKVVHELEHITSQTGEIYDALVKLGRRKLEVN